MPEFTVVSYISSTYLECKNLEGKVSVHSSINFNKPPNNFELNHEEKESIT